MTFNNAERKHIRNAEKAAALALANRIEYTRHIMSSVGGRAWMHDLLVRCHVFASPFRPGAPDVTAFSCGEQNIGLQVFADVATHTPIQYQLMMQEATTKEQASDRRNSDDGDAGTTAGRDGNPTDTVGPTVDADGFVNYPAEAGGYDHPSSDTA